MSGLEAEERFLYPAESHWPSLQIAVDPAAAEDRDVLLGEDTALYPESPSGRVEVDRAAGVARFRGVAELASDAIVHPRLGMLAAVYAQWLPRRLAFHAGGFVSGGRAWAVVGARLDGKSTLMAALDGAGFEVLGDDTLVLDGSRCFAGVRCIDLRPDAARHLRLEDQVVRVRRGTRDRLHIGPAPDPAPLAGWLFLSWNEELSVRSLAASERFARIGSAQGWHRRGVTSPARLLELAALPAWELARPKNWAYLPAIVARIEELVA